MGALTLGAVAAARSLRAVEELTAWLAGKLRRVVGIRGRISDTTLSEALAGLTQRDLRACLHRAVKAEHRRKGLEPTVIPFGVVAIDGKGVGKLDSWDHPDVQKVAPKGAPPYGLARTHRAHLVSSTATVCIDVRPIPGATNEVGAVRDFLEELVDAYRHTSLFEVVTADAGNCSQEVARWLDEHQLGYFLAIKGPQGDIHALALQELGRRPEKAAELETTERARGKRITHRLYRYQIEGGCLEWTHARQLIRVERVLTNPETGEVESTGNRFFVTNLVRGKLKPEGWLTLSRIHWRCENEGHWTSDVFWNEDARRTPWTTKPEAVYSLVVIRMIAQNILAMFRRMTRRTWDPRPPRWQELIDLVRALLRLAAPAEDDAVTQA